MKHFNLRLPRFWIMMAVGLFALTSRSQPCEFSWDRIVNADGSTSNYITPAKAQPYQGPCMSYSFTGAMEAMAKIESEDPSYFIDLSVPYFDMVFWGDSEQGIGSKMGAGQLIPANGCGNFPPRCTDEASQCKVANPLGIKPRLGQNNRECFTISGGPTISDPSDPTPMGGYSVSYYDAFESLWFGAQNITRHWSTINTQDDIKNLIMDEGPVVVYIPTAYINNFRDYGSSLPGFHSFLIIGWQDEPGGVRWKIRDSWPGMSGIHLTHPDPGLPGLVAGNNLRLHTVSGVYRYLQNPGTQFPSFDKPSQCVVDRNARPVIDQLFIARSPVEQNVWNTIVGHASSQVDIVAWDFQTPASAAFPINVYAGGWGERDFKCHVDGTWTFGARAKSEYGLWSDWHYITVVVEPPTSGGGNGPW